MRQTYGKTAWGAAWVRALERIDYDTNRLPRGRTYANTGRVRSIRVVQDVIHAAVQGSRPRPYAVDIRIKAFTARAIKAIKKAIAEHPSLAPELSLGRLPALLLDVLETEGIHLFPAGWDDIKAECSCPDWANPCKHLAAVYYIVANEVDKNPFILFSLRGIPSAEITAAAGLAATRLDAVPEAETETLIPFRQARSRDTAGSADELNLSFARADTDALFALLPDNPLFYAEGNFKKILQMVYQTATRAADAVSIADSVALSLNQSEFTLLYGGSSGNRRSTLDRFSPPQVFVSPALARERSPITMRAGTAAEVRLVSFAGKTPKLEPRKGVLWELNEAVDFFLQLPLDTSLYAHSPTSRFLNVAVSVALALVRAGAFVPQVAAMENGGFSIRYAPLAKDGKIRHALAFLAGIMPVGAGFDAAARAAVAPASVPVIVARILTATVHVLLERARLEIPRDKLTAVFVTNAAYVPARFEERNTAKALHDWLSRFALRGKDVAPVLRIETGAKGDHFVAFIEAENKLDALAPLLPLARVLREPKTIFGRPAEQVRIEVLRSVSIAAEYLPWLNVIVNLKGRDGVVVNFKEMARLLGETAAILDLLGVKIILPKELKKLAAPELVLTAAASANADGASYLNLLEMLDFSYEIAIGEQKITPHEFRKMVQAADGLVKLRDQYVLIGAEQASAILRKLEGKMPALSAHDALRSALAGEYDGVRFEPDAALARVLADLTKVEDIAIPAGLNATLRPYQVRGFRWLYANAQKGFGSCLADDMGLGKTIQVLSLLLRLKEEGRLAHPALVVCPTTLVGNWHKECARFAPSLAALMYHGAQRRLQTAGHDLVITTYGTVRRDLAKFSALPWRVLILDEAQNIKNPAADQSQAVKAIRADACIALSGTPVENRLTELWSIFDCVGKGYLGNLARFKKDFATPIEKYRDQRQIDKLRCAIAPFLMRRLKTDKAIISDLPEKMVMDEYCYLTKEQAALYQKQVQNALKIIAGAEGIERRGLIFKMITALKQICNHPAQYAKRGAALKEASGKAEKTVALVGNLLAAREKALIFTQYREMGDLLAAMIERESNERPLFFHGGLSRPNRDRLVAEFQENPAAKIMVISLRAGGTGLNLTAAANVIHYDLWWNPAVEAQATDRAYRIGQRKNVMVHRLITLGTFEEKIDEMIKAKQDLANLTVAAGEQWVSELSNRELKELFSLGT